MSKQLPRLSYLAFQPLSLLTRTAPAHIPRKDSDTVPPPPTMVLPAGEVHMHSVTNPHPHPRTSTASTRLPEGQTPGPEHTWVTMVTPRAEGQVAAYACFPATALEGARPLRVKGQGQNWI